MIHLHLTPESLLRTRFVFSPLVELSVSYYALKRGKMDSSLAHRRWGEHTQRALCGVELPLMDALIGTSGYVPDFLTPTPTRLEFQIENSLAQLNNTPPDLIQRDIGMLITHGSESPLIHGFRHDPQAYKAQLIDELRLYWQLVFQQAWPTIVNVVEGDLLFRSRQLALQGSVDVLSDLDQSATFDGKALRLNKAHYKKQDEHYVLDQEGLHLVPSVFGHGLMWQIAPDYQPMVIYSARGVGQWQIDQPDLDESLELLLGAGRASVLAELDQPATTSELAVQLHLTAGAVSQHLNLLQRAGLVQANRSGKRVYYSLSQKGSELLRLFR